MASRNLTILLTDIKGFTQKTSHKSRADILAMLEKHKELVLPVLEQHGGRLIKTIGDAFMMVYESPTDAVLAGMAVQEKLRVYNDGRLGDDRIDVRIAINAGEVTLADDDIFGDPVNITARIESIAEAGEVYFTEAVYLAMNKQEVPSAEIGMLQLKGLAEKVRVYKVKREDPVEDLPPGGDLGAPAPKAAAAPPPAAPAREPGGPAKASKLKRALALAVDLVLVAILTGALTGGDKEQIQVSAGRRPPTPPASPGSIKIDDKGIEIGGVRIDDKGVHGGRIEITEDGIKIKSAARGAAAKEAQAEIDRLQARRQDILGEINKQKALERSARRVGRSSAGHVEKIEELEGARKEVRRELEGAKTRLERAHAEQAAAAPSANALESLRVEAEDGIRELEDKLQSAHGRLAELKSRLAKHKMQAEVHQRRLKRAKARDSVEEMRELEIQARIVEDQARSLEEQSRRVEDQARELERTLERRMREANQIGKTKPSGVREEVLYDEGGLRIAKRSKKGSPAFAIFWLLYQVFFLQLWSTTPGGKIAKVRLVEHDTGKDVDWKLALARTLMTFVSTMPLLSGWIWALLQKEGRGWHDIIAGTRVAPQRPASS